MLNAHIGIREPCRAPLRVFRSRTCPQNSNQPASPMSTGPPIAIPRRDLAGLGMATVHTPQLKVLQSLNLVQLPTPAHSLETGP
ncbi:hypothetical protein PCANC_05795 [Puccinia coronata f. sp. avenae]|uniref:Uncharacterized protein n=1 Tax=Puccinia coronata f. sp. avenae TaxID=200324 RepID=A0A2N5V5F7_9BASI|nr:hypothetical protein PCANC_11376 [Puccinia coronata f. sp. avenae]PLW22618.1 hypothetical protein PCASD_12221 [Puccinia coronata f. sp. avenae]PLW45225.1 hypothetical protein PCASD_04022 [Puccinia coronata f. sp. avenae]PLW53075.1 hypothetical protein PCANC_05795 [Puccinia coronata f. sp. avenae]